MAVYEHSAGWQDAIGECLNETEKALRKEGPRALRGNTILKASGQTLLQKGLGVLKYPDSPGLKFSPYS